MSTDKQLAIDGRNVAKVFKDFWGRAKVTAVKGVDIAVPEGAVFGLLGPNGAGKSTLMKMILGHLYPTGGSLTVLGQSPRNVEGKRRLGYVPEREFFYKNLTATETLSLFGQILDLSTPEIRRRTEQLLEMVGLQHARNRLVGEFSHGMGRRLGLAQALLNDPDLLILDEPTAGLDPVGCYEVKQLIRTLGKRGKTVLMSSHLLADVEDVCDVIMVMYGGQVQQVGHVRELLARKDEVLIRAPAVAPETIEKAKQLLAGKGGTAEVEVTYPTRSLEDYFLEIVRTADEKQVETAGARVGTGVAEYLQTGAGDAELLQQLTRTSAPEPSATAEAAESAPAEDTGLLDALTGVGPGKEAGEKAEPRPGDDVDTDYLSQLTRGGK